MCFSFSYVLAGPAESVAAALADARRLQPGVRERTRYLDTSIFPKDYREEAGKALAFQANQLSREAFLVSPRPVAGNLLAVVLDDYRWDRATWEKFAAIDPYYHVQVDKFTLWPGGVWPKDGLHYGAGTFRVRERVGASSPWLPTREIAELITLTQSQAPIVRADWWFAQTARQLSLGNQQTGVGYYDWLGVKKRADFEKLVRLDAKASLDIGKELRAAVERSGVATQNRQVVRLQSLTGGYWVTLDADESTGKKNALRLLGRGDYQHTAEEIYGVLPNGLFAFFLGDDKGVRQDSAPDFIGADDSPLRNGRDGRIHVGLACVRCHVDGLRPIDDWVRRTLRQPLALQAVDYAKFVELRRAYFGDLEKQRKKDADAYAEVVRELTGWTVAENAKAFARLWDWYALRDRGPAELAAEMGVAEAKLLDALRGYAAKTGYLDLPLSGLLQVPPVPLRVEHVEEAMPLLWQIVGY